MKSGLFSAYDTVWLSDLECEQNAVDLSDCGFKTYNTTHFHSYVEIDAVCCSDFNLIDASRCIDSTTSHDNACTMVFQNFDDAVVVDTSSRPDPAYDLYALEPHIQYCFNTTLSYDWGCLSCPPPTSKVEIAPTIHVQYNDSTIVLNLNAEQYINNQLIVYEHSAYVLIFHTLDECFD